MSSIFKSRLNFKNVICIILAFCMVFSAFMPLAKIIASAGTETEKMLSIKVNSINSQYDELRTLVTAEVGKTYYFSFSLSQAMDNCFEVVCRANNEGGVKVGVNADIKQVSKDKNGKLYDYKYSFTIPEKDNNGNPMTSEVFFIIRFKSSCEGYLKGVSAYAADDTNQTELLSNGGFKSGLSGWYMEATSLSSSGNEYSDGSYVEYKVLDFDDTLLEVEIDFNMLHIKKTSSSGNFEFKVPVDVTVGKTYNYTFALSDTITESDFELVFRAVTGSWTQPGVTPTVTPVIKEKNGKSNFYTYSITIPATDNNGGDISGKDLYFIIRFKNAAVCEGYFFGATVYDSEDSEKTELLSNPNFTLGLGGWVAGYKEFNNGDTEGTDTNNTTTLKVMDFDDSLVDTPVVPKMLSIDKTDTNRAELKNSIPVEAGKTYYYTFGLSDTITTDDFEVVCRVNTGSGTQPGVSAGIQLASKKDYKKSSVYTYSFTVPENDSNIGSNELYFIVRFKTVCKGYFFNPTVYKVDDENKTNLMDNADFCMGLNGWIWEYNTFAEGKTEAEVTSPAAKLKIVDFDDSLLEPSENTPKMLSIDKTSTARGEFKTSVPVEAGKTYYYTFGLSNTITTDDFEVVCRVNTGSGTQPGVSANIKQVKKVVNKISNIYTYSFTVPENDSNIGSNELYFIVRFKTVCEGYFFNPTVYKADDENQTELLDNADFSLGLNGWIWEFKNFEAGQKEADVTDYAVKLAVVELDESLLEMSENTPKMLHVNKTGTSDRGEFMQLVPVQVGETYYYTFGITDTIDNFEVVCRTSDDSKRTGVNASIALAGKELRNKSAVYTYSFTIPEKDNNGKAVTDKVFFIIRFPQSETYEGHIFNPSVYKAGDESKTELLTNFDFKTGLDEWALGYSWLSGNSWSNSDIALEIVPFDETYLELAENTPKMLYVNKTGSARAELMQLVPVTAGKTYYYTFGLTDTIDKFEIVCRASDDGKRAGVNADITQVKKEVKNRGAIYTYSFTIPEKDNNGNAITDKVFFIVRFPQDSTYEGNLYLPSVYKADDDAKTELLENSSFQTGLEKWSLDYNWLSGNSWSNSDIEVKIVGFDEGLLEKNKDLKSMLHFKTTRAKELMQRALVEVGETYHFTFALTDNLTNFSLICLTDDKRRNVDANIKLVEELDKDGYTVYTYSYTIPATFIDGEGKEAAMTKNVFFGIKAAGTCEALFFDASVYKADDKNKTELLENPDFKVGLDRWAWGWDAWFAHNTQTPAGLTEWSNADTLLELVEYSDKSIADMIAKIPSKKMVYFINGTKSSNFASRVTLEEGGEYCIEFSGYSTGDFDIKVTEDGSRPTIRVDYELISEVKKGNYTTYTYKFTMPDEVDTEQVFVGVLVNFFTEGFLFDMQLYKADDVKKKNLWNNSTFGVGLDGWIWDWHAWFGTWEENPAGTFEWSGGSNTVKVMEFDLSKIDELIAALNINDGKWWNDKDIIKETVIETATLKGTLLDQNNAPLSDVKLVLISEDKTYTAVTDKNGNFVFSNFIAGFYELYAVDSEGNNVPTGYYTNFYGGDVSTLKLVCDSSGIHNEDASEEENGPTGSLLGTVYTPDLKTVAGLKLYIRGVGETLTDQNGYFEFTEIPVGEYELYTVLEDGSEYVFRKAEIKENVELSVKLKYAPVSDTSADGDGLNWLLVIIFLGAVLVIAAGVTVFIIFKKKKATKN